MRNIRFKIGFAASIITVMLGVLLLADALNSPENLILGIISIIVDIIDAIICWVDIKHN